MYSVKPGRGPSAGGVVVGILVALCGVFWTIAAANMGAPWPMVLFGVAFVGIAIAGCFYNFHNATSANRFSDYDIVPSAAEPDPLDRPPSQAPSASAVDAYCPYCGAALSAQFNFCPKCGKPVQTTG